MAGVSCRRRRGSSCLDAASRADPMRRTSVSATAKRRLGGWLAGLIVVASVPVALVLGTMPQASALANGPALTPPAGSDDWHPLHAGLNEAGVKKAADARASKALEAAGYPCLDTDDAWAQ